MPTPIYCLPIIRRGDRFVPDPDYAGGRGELSPYSTIKDYLARHHRAIQAQLEVEGITHTAQVFEARSSDDINYALVDASGHPTAPSPTLARVWHFVEDYLARLRRALSFSDPFPPTHASYLPTEFIEPSFLDWTREVGASRRATWKDIAASARLVILGEAGSGKTSCLRMLALEESRRATADAVRRLPVYLQLRDLSTDLDLLTIAKRAVELSDDSQWDDMVASGRLLLLLDGVDELAPQKREWLKEQVQVAVRRFPGIGLILSARRAGFDWDLTGFRIAELEPFDLARQREWLARRVQRTSTRLSRELMTHLSHSSAMASLAGNPLLLAVAAAYVERVKQVPTRPATLLLRYVECLVDDWDQARGFQRWAPTPFSKERKLDVLCRTAFTACERGQTSFLSDEFTKWELRWSPRSEAQHALKTLWQHSGLLVPQSPDSESWCFSHTAVKELLAAKYLLDRPDDALPLLARSLPAELLSSIWLYACEMTTDASPLIAFMIERSTANEDTRAEFVAKALVEEVSIPSEVYALGCDFVASRLHALCSPLRVATDQGDEGRWFLEVKYTRPEQSSRDALSRVGRLIGVVGVGLQTARRRLLAERIAAQKDEVCQTLGARIVEGSQLTPDVDLPGGRVLIKGEKEAPDAAGDAS